MRVTSCVCARWLAVAWLLAMLVACAPLADPGRDPWAAVPASYPGSAASTPAPGDALAASASWQQFFIDPELLRVIAQALTANHDLRLAVLRADEAMAAHGLQRADRLPTLAASLAATRAGVPGDLNLTGRPVVGAQWQLGVGFTSWEIDFWGRVRSQNDAALQAYLSADAAQHAARTALVAQVAQSWLALRETEERLVLAQRTLATRAEAQRIFRRRVELGATSRLELTQVELLWQQAKLLVAQLQQVQATQANALNLLVGAPVAWAPSAERLEDLQLARPLRAGLPSELLVSRPDIAAAEFALRSARANVQAARAAFFPRIALTASAGTASAELAGLWGAGSQAWSFAPVLALPLFDGGRRQAAFDLAEVRQEQAVVRYEQAVQAAFRDVADALAAQRSLVEQLQAQRAMLATQQERARLARLRYDSGAVRYLEVLDAERDLLAAEQQLVQLRRAELAAQVVLYAALGGGARHARPGEGRKHQE